MSAIATQKGVRISPRKVAVVADLVRGRSVADAITILEFTPRRAALPVKEAIIDGEVMVVTPALVHAIKLCREHPEQSPKELF